MSNVFKNKNGSYSLSGIMGSIIISICCIGFICTLISILTGHTNQDVLNVIVLFSGEGVALLSLRKYISTKE